MHGHVYEKHVAPHVNYLIPLKLPVGFHINAMCVCSSLREWNYLVNALNVLHYNQVSSCEHFIKRDMTSWYLYVRTSLFQTSVLKCIKCGDNWIKMIFAITPWNLCCKSIKKTFLLFSPLKIFKNMCSWILFYAFLYSTFWAATAFETKQNIKIKKTSAI